MATHHGEDGTIGDNIQQNIWRAVCFRSAGEISVHAVARDIGVCAFLCLNKRPKRTATH